MQAPTLNQRLRLRWSTEKVIGQDADGSAVARPLSVRGTVTGIRKDGQFRVTFDSPAGHTRGEPRPRFWYQASQVSGFAELGKS